MTDAQTLRELIERCEKAAGPDRELDALITIAFHYAPIPLVERHDASHISFEHAGQGRIDAWAKDSDGSSQRFWHAFAHHLTASIDSAFAFMREVLPGWQVREICEEEADVWSVSLLAPSDSAAWRVCSPFQRRPLPLVIVTTTLRARLAEMEASSE